MRMEGELSWSSPCCQGSSWLRCTSGQHQLQNTPDLTLRGILSSTCCWYLYSGLQCCCAVQAEDNGGFNGCAALCKHACASSATVHCSGVLRHLLAAQREESTECYQQEHEVRAVPCRGPMQAWQAHNAYQDCSREDLCAGAQTALSAPMPMYREVQVAGKSNHEDTLHSVPIAKHDPHYELHEIN